MKKYLILIVFVCMVLPLSAQATHGVYSTAEDTYQKSVLRLGTASSYGGSMVFTSSFSAGTTTMRTSSSPLLSSKLFKAGGTFVSSDAYLTPDAPAPVIRRMSVPNPGGGTWTGPLSDGTWCLLILSIAYVVYLFYRKRRFA